MTIDLHSRVGARFDRPSYVYGYPIPDSATEILILGIAGLRLGSACFAVLIAPVAETAARPIAGKEGRRPVTRAMRDVRLIMGLIILEAGRAGNLGRCSAYPA